MSEPLFAVLLAQPDYLQTPQLFNAVAAHNKIPFHDGAHAAREAWGILATSLAESEAQRYKKNLDDAGVGGVIVPQETLAPLSSVQLLKTMVLEKFPSWGCLRVIAAAGIEQSTSVTRTEKQGPSPAQTAVNMGIMLTTGLPIKIGPKKQTVSTTVTNKDWLFYVDLLFAEPRQRFRIDVQRFDFSFLKERMVHNTVGNLKLMLAEFMTAAPSALISRGTKTLVENKMFSTMGYGMMSHLEREEQWLETLSALEKPR